MISRIQRFEILYVLLALMLQRDLCTAYTMNMVYKPPVKSSVGGVSQRNARPGNGIAPDASSVRPSSSTSTFATSLPLDANRQPSIPSRVKNMVIGGLKSRLSRRRKVQVVEDINEFNELIRDEQQDHIAVMFHAPFCKACQAALPHFQRLARKYSDVKFISVPLTESNSKFLKALGIPKFPFGHLYDPEKGLVEELPMLRKLVPKFEERLVSRMSKEEGKQLETEDTANL